jgi:hypothetical protein
MSPTPTPPVGNTKALEAIQKVNALLSAAIPTVGLVIGAIELARELFRRKESGEPDMTLEEAAELLVEGGKAIMEKSDMWLADHGYGPDGKKQV